MSRGYTPAMKKSFACFLLAFVAAFIVTGCEKKPEPPKTSDVPTNTPAPPK